MDEIARILRDYNYLPLRDALDAVDAVEAIESVVFNAGYPVTHSQETAAACRVRAVAQFGE